MIAVDYDDAPKRPSSNTDRGQQKSKIMKEFHEKALPEKGLSSV